MSTVPTAKQKVSMSEFLLQSEGWEKSLSNILLEITPVVSDSDIPRWWFCELAPRILGVSHDQQLNQANEAQRMSEIKVQSTHVQKEKGLL